MLHKENKIRLNLGIECRDSAGKVCQR